MLFTGWSLVLLSIAISARAHTIGAFLRHEIDLRGHPIYVPAHRCDPVTSGLDAEALHHRRIPEYFAALAHTDTQIGRRRATDALHWLERSLGRDENLRDLWRELDLLLRVDVLRHARRIDYLLWAHNEYVDSLGLPYRIEVSLRLRDERPLLDVRSYTVLADRVNGDDARVRVVQRIDQSARRETWLGHTSGSADGAILVGDRIHDFTIREVWPLLAPGTDERLDAHVRPLADAVRRSIREVLDPHAYGVLETTAEDQLALLESARSIDARHRCGSSFRVYGLPYRGLSRRSYEMLGVAVELSRRSPCPDVTLFEASQIVGASERLRATDDVAPALELLNGVVARAVAAHELRHVVDGPSRELPCPGCRVSMPPLVLAEVSAYLATLAAPETAPLALLMACVNRSTDGIDAAAITLVSRAIGYRCGEPLPEDLTARAERAEHTLFGTRSATHVPSTFPRSLSVLDRPVPIHERERAALAHR